MLLLQIEDIWEDLSLMPATNIPQFPFIGSQKLAHSEQALVAICNLACEGGAHLEGQVGVAGVLMVGT